MTRLISGSAMKLALVPAAAFALVACGQGATAAAGPDAKAEAVTTARHANAAKTDAGKNAGPAVAAEKAPAAGDDAVRDLAQLSASDLAFPNAKKKAFLAKYFNLRDDVDGMGECQSADNLTGDTFDYICGWNSKEFDEAPTLLVAMNTVRPDPNIWSAVVWGHGDNPLGGAWICGPAQYGDAKICTLKTQSADRPKMVEQWNKFLNAAG